jgi:hypothetical protein
MAGVCVDAFLQTGITRNRIKETFVSKLQSVGQVNANVDVRGTAPGMLATQ